MLQGVPLLALAQHLLRGRMLIALYVHWMPMGAAPILPSLCIFCRFATGRWRRGSSGNPLLSWRER
jgi:hypothetical protein